MQVDQQLFTLATEGPTAKLMSFLDRSVATALLHV